MDTITLTLTRDKDTPNSARFRGESDDGVKGQLYVPLADAPEKSVEAVYE